MEFDDLVREIRRLNAEIVQLRAMLESARNELYTTNCNAADLIAEAYENGSERGYNEALQNEGGW